MARTTSPTLTEAELRLMEVLWRIGSGTTREVLSHLPESDARAYSTIRTTLGILEDKGYLDHREEDRTFVYVPRVERGEAQRSAVRHLVGSFFNGSPERLVLNVLEDEALDTAEIERLRKAIDAAPDGLPEKAEPLESQRS